MPLAMADRITGLMAASAINAALVHQLRSGEGQLVEVPMFETMLNFVLGDHLGGKVFDPPLDARRLWPAALARPQALPDEGRLRLHHDLQRPAVAQFLRRRRLARPGLDRSALRQPCDADRAYRRGAGDAGAGIPHAHHRRMDGAAGGGRPAGDAGAHAGDDLRGPASGGDRLLRARRTTRPRAASPAWRCR